MLRRTLLVAACLLAACSDKAQLPTADEAARAAEVKKLQLRQEISALYEEWQKEKILLAYYEEDQRHVPYGSEMAKEDSKEAMIHARKADEISRQSIKKFGVPAAELPRLFAP